MEYFDYCVCYIDNHINRAVADKLVKEVSSYEIPKNIRENISNLNYKRSCVLPLLLNTPLSNEQKYLLNNCRWLLVICRKQERDALSISHAINFFNGLNKRDNILPVLFEGEPADAFPSELLEVRVTNITFRDGSTQEVKEIIEPLAIDIRARDLKSSLSQIHHLRIKTVAALIGVSYDTLEQRHDKRLRRRIRLLSSVFIAIPVILGCLFTYLWLNSEQKIDIAANKTQISKDLLADMCQNYPILFRDIPQIEPYVNTLLLESLEKLRVVESGYIPLLPVQDLLLPNDNDNLNSSRNKAKIHRYLGNKAEAIKAYIHTSALLEQGSDVYERISEMFVNNTDPKVYPNGILVVETGSKISESSTGLNEGDLIVEIGGFKFRNLEQYEVYLRKSVPQNKPIRITVLRPVGDEFEILTLSLKSDDFTFKGEEM